MSHPALALRLHGTWRAARPGGLYAQVLGQRFRCLHTSIQRLHGELEDVRGICHVQHGKLTARLIARLLGLPRAGERQALRVVFDRITSANRIREHWHRWFAGHRLSTWQWQEGEQLCERFGPLVFGFHLRADKTGLRHELAGCRLIGLRLPRWLWPAIEGDEWPVGRNGVGFRVRVALPLLGTLIEYGGMVYVGDMDAATAAVHEGNGSDAS